SEILNHANRLDVRIDQATRDQGHHQQRNFQICVRNNRIAELLGIELFRGIERGILFCFAGHNLTSTDVSDHGRSQARVCPGCSAEKVVRQSRNLQQPVNCDEQKDQHRGECRHPLIHRHAARVDSEEGQQELGEDVNEGAGNDLIEGVLKKCLEPTPEQPIHLRHDKEWNEYRSDQQKHCLGYQSESDDHQDNSLDCGQYHVQYDERKGLVKAERARLLHSLLDFSDLRLDQPPLLHANAV